MRRPPAVLAALFLLAVSALAQRLRPMLLLPVAPAPRQPWPEALEALSGEKQMDATAMLDYFAPLKPWFDRRNAGHEVGW